MRDAALGAMILVALFAIVACSRPDSRAAESRPENLLLITLDTTRADSLGAYGGEPGVTPRLDDLAKSGARFDQAIAPVPLTRPSHATILTGLLPHSHTVWSNGPYRLEPNFPVLSETFREAGFTTGAVVASFVLSRSFGLARGFEHFDDSTHQLPDGDPEKTAEQVVDIAAQWLDGRIRPPFFLWLHFYDPHTPYSPPEPYLSRFAGQPYLGEIAYLDHEIGRFLDKLDGLDLTDETLIIVVADHGEGLGEHSEDTHGYFLYDNTVRVPLLLKGPGVAPRTTVASQVTLADLAPTLLEAFQMRSADDRFDGRSFWSELLDSSVEDRPALIENRAIRHQYGWAPLAGIRTDGWKWILAPEPELYRLADDPEENRNLAPANTELSRELESRRRRLLPEEPEELAISALSPEAEAQLRALGYLSAPASPGPSTREGPDPKTVAGAITAIEALTQMRRGGDAGQIEALIDSILRIDPTNLFALRLEGQRLVEERRFEEAIDLLDEIVAGHDTHPEALAFLAMAYEGIGKSREAISWFLKASTPPWIFWPALESLARLSVSHPAELPRDALLNRLQHLQPQSPRERLSVARAYAILADHARAEHIFASAVAADPMLTEARVGLAQMQAAQGRTDAALATLDLVRPPTVESVFVTGSILWRGKRKEEACREFRQAMTLDPRNVNLLFGLGRYLEACREPALAVEALQRLLVRQPRHPEAVEALRRLAAASPGSG